MSTFVEKIKDMEVEKMYNDWCEQAKKEIEKIGKKNILLPNGIQLKDVNMSAPTLKQEENGEYTISLVLNYWSEDEIQKLKNYINNYGKTTKAT